VFGPSPSYMVSRDQRLGIQLNKSFEAPGASRDQSGAWCYVFLLTAGRFCQCFGAGFPGVTGGETLPVMVGRTYHSSYHRFRYPVPGPLNLGRGATG